MLLVLLLLVLLLVEAVGLVPLMIPRPWFRILSRSEVVMGDAVRVVGREETAREGEMVRRDGVSAAVTPAPAPTAAAVVVVVVVVDDDDPAAVLAEFLPL